MEQIQNTICPHRLSSRNYSGIVHGIELKLPACVEGDV